MNDIASTIETGLGSWTGVMEPSALVGLLRATAQATDLKLWMVDASGVLVMESNEPTPEPNAGQGPAKHSCPSDCAPARETVAGHAQARSGVQSAHCDCGAMILAANIPDEEGSAGVVLARAADGRAMPAAATELISRAAEVLGALWRRTWELRQRVDELRALYNVSATLAGRTRLQEILDLATRLLVEVLDLRGASLRLVDEETGELKEASVARLSEAYQHKGPLSVDSSLVDAEALTGKTVYVANLPEDPRTVYKEAARREGLVSALVTALFWRGKAIGVLRAYTDRPHRFTSFEESLMKAIASQAAAAITNARLRNEMREAERLERQVMQAMEVQRRMIPAAAPRHPHYRFGCVYEPSHELCGDFYDLLEFDTGDIGLVVADVAGKGVAASLMMASARSALRAHAKRVYDVDEVMRELNLRMCHDTLESEFITLFYGVLSADGRRLTYCNAGHEPPLLLRGGRVTALDVNGTVLGIDPDAEFTRSILHLHPGDLWICCTDGLVEAVNFSDEAYGRQRLEMSLRLHGSMPDDMPTELIARQLLWDVRRFAGLSSLADDITLVVTQVS